MRFSEIRAKRIAIWGWGREGQTVYAALRAWQRRHCDSGMPCALTLFCSPHDVLSPQVEADSALTVCRQVTAEHLMRFDVIIKSPGISPYHPPASVACQAGVRFISETQLWFAEQATAEADLPYSLCVTGTKGKSTTTALIAHLLRAAGHRTALAGNIGLPLFDLAATVPPAQFWAIELSSFQTRAVAESGVRPHVAVVLNVFSEHLDWHGSWSRYCCDKLALLTDARPKIAVLNATDPVLRTLSLPHSRVMWFNHPAGWHIEDQTLKYQKHSVLSMAQLPLAGQHNRENLCAALTALDAVGLDAMALAHHVHSFRPLPHRLQILGCLDALTWVNDSISTTPQASLAALARFSGRPVVLLLGGFDRGIDWNPCAERFTHDAPLVIVTFGANGRRIYAALAPYAPHRFRLEATERLADAVHLARHLAVGSHPVVLLSPGAPSFDAYTNYIERGHHFATLAGFDQFEAADIPGLGIF